VDRREGEWRAVRKNWLAGCLARLNAQAKNEKRKASYSNSHLSTYIYYREAKADVHDVLDHSKRINIDKLTTLASALLPETSILALRYASFFFVPSIQSRTLGRTGHFP
jgi:hypothetical protein